MITTIDFQQHMGQKAYEHLLRTQAACNTITACYDQMFKMSVEHLDARDVVLLELSIDSKQCCSTDGQAHLDQQLTDVYGPYSEADPAVQRGRALVRSSAFTLSSLKVQVARAKKELSDAQRMYNRYNDCT